MYSDEGLAIYTIITSNGLELLAIMDSLLNWMVNLINMRGKYMKAFTFALTAITLITATNLIPTVSFAKSAAGLEGLDVPKLIKVAQADGLQPKALKAALNAYSWAYQHNKLGENKHTMTVVDFTLPSYAKRMWVIDLKSDKILLNTYTAQGKNSGLVYATQFSNAPATYETSLGIYATAGEYYGEHAKSMHLAGLEPGINDNAYRRAVEIHAAQYVTPEFIQAHHRAGRSWGCFAVSPTVKDQLLNYTNGGSALFAYAPQEDHDPIVKDGPLAV